MVDIIVKKGNGEREEEKKKIMERKKEETPFLIFRLSLYMSQLPLGVNRSLKTSSYYFSLLCLWLAALCTFDILFVRWFRAFFVANQRHLEKVEFEKWQNFGRVHTGLRTFSHSSVRCYLSLLHADRSTLCQKGSRPSATSFCHW
jgi:hypothetical protein